MTKRKKGFRFLEAVGFCALVLVLIAGVSRIVERKASSNDLQPFLENAEDFDVIFTGDSHMVNAVFPMELWRDYGIASYNLACYGNTVPVTYWTLMNALDYAHPKLVVIDVKDANQELKITASSSDLHTALDGFPLTRTKAQAIEDLIDDPKALDDAGDRFVDIKWEYYFKLGKYHTRWSELEPSDFHPVLSCQKGASFALRVADPIDYDIIEDWEYLEENGWGFMYLRKMIEACLARDIQVLVVYLPYPSNVNDQKTGNTCRLIADEYDVDFIDFVNLDQVVDYKSDCYDPYSHLNPSGAQKVTDFLGRYITEHYGIADHRGEPRYASWTDDYDRYMAYKRAVLRNEEDLKVELALLHDDDFSACISIQADSPFFEDEKLVRLMQNIAREHIYEEDAFAKWSDGLMPLEEIETAGARRTPYFLFVDRKKGQIEERVGWTDEAGEMVETENGMLRYRCTEGELSLQRDGEELFAAVAAEGSEDVRITVFDNRTGEIAAERAFHALEEKETEEEQEMGDGQGVKLR